MLSGRPDTGRGGRRSISWLPMIAAMAAAVAAQIARPREGICPTA